MTDRELEQRLADAVNRAAPNDLEAILSRCGAQNGSVMKLNALQEHSNIIDVDGIEVKPKRRRFRWLAAACAALVLLGAGGGGLVYHQSYAVASVVSLDVNPSIELRVNRNEKVLSCTALNEEAAAVLFDMGGGDDLKGTKLDVAVNAIVGALVREGYMDSISSAILISVGLLQTYNDSQWTVFGATLGGTIYLLILGYVVNKIPYTLRMTKAAFYSIDDSLEDAAKNLGAGGVLYLHPRAPAHHYPHDSGPLGAGIQRHAG